MITVRAHDQLVQSLTGDESDRLRSFDPIRKADIASIRRFMEAQRAYLTGRVLDFGAGKPGTCRQPQPYRDLVSGEYLPYDLGDQLPTPPFDTIICTQVMQYLFYPRTAIEDFAGLLNTGGHLVMTYGTNWTECEDTDLFRFTKLGMEQLLRSAEFTIIEHNLRARVMVGNFSFATGYGVVARMDK